MNRTGKIIITMMVVAFILKVVITVESTMHASPCWWAQTHCEQTEKTPTSTTVPPAPPVAEPGIDVFGPFLT